MPKLSVLVTFCNQTNFIEQALNSIIKQQTTYEYEVLIGLDGPDEASKEIIDEYLKKHDNFKLFEVENNRKELPRLYKASLNKINLLKQAKGEYICFLDGDDFYCDNSRFQKLLDLLEDRLNIIGIAHNYEELNNETQTIKSNKYPFDKQECKVDLEGFIDKDKYLPASCFIFRNIFQTKIPDDLDTNLFNDIYITHYMLRYGDIYYIPDIMFLKRTQLQKKFDKKTQIAYKIFISEKIYEMLPYYKKNFCKILTEGIKEYKALHNKESNFSIELEILVYMMERYQEEKTSYFAYNAITFQNLSIMQKNIFLANLTKFTYSDTGGDFKTYKLFYNKENGNFGDALNLYILQRIFKLKLSRVKEFDFDLYASGSVLDLLFEDEDNFKMFSFGTNALIWGSGFSNVVPKTNNKKLKGVKIVALRGTLTKAKIAHYTKQDLSDILLGDPCILASKLIDAIKVEKKYKLGILLSKTEKIPEITQEGVLFIDIEKNPMFVLEQIASCEVILSSLLAGLVVADSLNIPNNRLITNEKSNSQNYIFDDYYSAYGVFAPVAIDIKNSNIDENLLETIKQNYQTLHLRQKVLQLQDDLMQSFLE